MTKPFRLPDAAKSLTVNVVVFEGQPSRTYKVGGPSVSVVKALLAAKRILLAVEFLAASLSVTMFEAQKVVGEIYRQSNPAKA